MTNSVFLNLSVPPLGYPSLCLHIQLGRHSSGLSGLSGSGWFGSLLGGHLHTQLLPSAG